MLNYCEKLEKTIGQLVFGRTDCKQMENDEGHEILVGYKRGRKLEVDFAERYNRKANEDEEVEGLIEKTWDIRKRENASLFNGRKFRFGGIRFDGDLVTLQLGLTDYKTYVGTHGVMDGLRKYGEDWMGQPLGNIVVPETSDGKTLLLVRSKHTSEGVGSLVFPGGHAEPDMMCLQDECTRNEVVKRELWEGARREVLEELWIGNEDIGHVEDMVLLGCVKRKVDGKVSTVFSVKIKLRAEEVVDRFRERNDGMESDRIVVMSWEEMTRLDGMHELNKFIAETKGAAQLWIICKREEYLHFK